jgi:hypothetical protein
VGQKQWGLTRRRKLMTIYTVDQDTEDKNLILVRRIVVIGLSIIGIVILFLMGYFLLEDDLTTSLILFLAFASMLGSVFILKKQYSKLQESYKTIEIELGEDHIALRQKYRPEIRIMKNEVTSLSASKNGFLVQSANKFLSIYIPDTLISYEEVKTEISSWAEFITASTKDNLKAFFPILLPSLGIIICAILILITRSAWPIGLMILFMLGRKIYFTWFNWRREDIKPEVKRNKLIAAGIVILVYIFLLVFFLYKVYLIN